MCLDGYGTGASGTLSPGSDPYLRPLIDDAGLQEPSLRNPKVLSCGSSQTPESSSEIQRRL